MIDKTALKFFLIATIPMIIPVPGRFAYALIMVLLFNLIISLGTLFLHGLHALHQDELKSILLVPFLIGVSVFLQQLLAIFFPYVIFALGIIIFVPALSVFIIMLLTISPVATIQEELKHNCIPSAFFSSGVLFYMLIRDILGYGTITFPVPSGIKECLIFDASLVPFTAFLASVPGVLIITVLLYVIGTYCKNKLMIINRVEKLHE